MIKFFQKNYFLLLLPLLINLFNNFNLKKIVINNIGFYDVVSSSMLFVFFFLFGYCFKLVFNDMTITFGIITYIFSFFIFESFALFIYTDINLTLTFLIVNLLWLIFYIFFLEEKKMIFYILASYFSMRYFNSSNFEMMTLNTNLIGDVYDVFFPNTQMIYENSYKISVMNSPTMQGYPQFMSYIDAFLYKLAYDKDKYDFIISNSLVFFWLNLLLFTELRTSKKSRFFIATLFIILLLNSRWLEFLFVSSLMSERIAGYLLAGILVTLFKIRKTQSSQLYFIFFMLGFIYITKQFFSIIVLILFFIFLMSSKYRKNSPLILSAFALQEIAYSTYFTNAKKNYHTTQIDILDTLQDLILFRDLNLSNVTEIIKNLSIDKPFTYLLLITIGLLCLKLITGKLSYEVKIYIVITILNLLFIFLLYISAWRNMELESPIRYIYSFLIFYLLLISNSVSEDENLK